MKRVLSILLIACMLLCGCSKEPAEQTTAPASTDTTAKSAETTVTTEPASEDTVPTDATEATVAVEEVKYRNPLNGAPLQEPYMARPIAVVINNIRAAQPLCSVSEADIVFEVLAEGGITRWLAIFDDVTGIEHIGSVRSARPYLVEIAYSLDAMFVHHGGSVDGYDRISELDVDHIDPLSGDSDAFYRDQERLDAGYGLEHTSFTDGQLILNAVADREFETVREEPIDYGFTFDKVGSTENGEKGEILSAVFGSYGKSTRFVLHKKTGTYVPQQYGDYIYDGNNDKALTFSNVLLITAETYTYNHGDGFRTNITLVGEGTGSFACQGKVVPIRWSRAAEGEPFVFTHEDGTPITLAVGRTYIAVTPSDGVLEYK